MSLRHQHWVGSAITWLNTIDLWECLLGEVNRQLEAKNIILTEGRINIIDATPIEAAQSGPGKGKDGQAKRDKEAGWHVKKDSRGNLKSTYGYSVHTGVDEDGFIQRQTVTAGNVHDSVLRDTLLLGDETALYADAAYSSKETRDKLERFGIADQVQRKGYRNKPLSRDDSTRNDEIDPTPKRKHQLRRRFDSIFTTKTNFVTLDRLLKRLHQRRHEFLRVLERPDIPMHTNGSENDIRCQVIKRKISGGTRSDDGRDCRDAFLSLMKTCAKLGINFWDYLGDRLSHPGAPNIPHLPNLIRQKETA